MLSISKLKVNYEDKYFRKNIFEYYKYYKYDDFEFYLYRNMNKNYFVGYIGCISCNCSMMFALQ